MHVWQLQEAKAKLTQLINESKTEPQVISRRGFPESVVISMDKYRELCGLKENIVTYFQSSPLFGLELDLKRDKSEFRDVDDL